MAEEQVANTLEPVVPPLSGDDQTALETALARQQALRDLTLGCIAGHHSGACIYGPPGIGKSHTIINTLRDKNANWKIHQRITSKPLFFALDRDPVQCT